VTLNNIVTKNEILYFKCFSSNFKVKLSETLVDLGERINVQTIINNSRIFQVLENT
jgi:hypothetical protein